MTTAGFTFDGVDPGATAAKLLLVDKRVGLVPESRRRAVAAGARPGVWDFGTQLGERRIELDLFSGDNANLAGTDAAVRSIAQLFDPTREVAGDGGFKQLVFDSEPDRYWLAKLIEDPFTHYLPSAGQLTLHLRCADPFAYATAQTVATQAGGAGAPVGLDVGPIDVGRIDVAAAAVLSDAVTAGGSYRTDAVIELTMAAPYTGTVILSNYAATGEYLTWTGALLAGDVLKIDSSTYRAYVNGVLSMSGVAAGSRWPQLMPAQVNTVHAVGPGIANVAQLRVTFRNRWI